MYLLVGILIGYLFGKYIGGKKEGDEGLIHWGWFMRTFKIHLHHWIIMSVILCVYLVVLCDYVGCDVNMLIIGFLLGGIMQGLTYSDRFELKVN